MKLKKKFKRMLIAIAAILVISLIAIILINFMPKDNKVKEAAVLKSIDEYGYKLKENKTKKYKEMFEELEKILREEEVDEKEYAKKVAEMFVYDFYSLADKAAKTDVGGVEFIHPNAVENFLLNAEDTYYKYVESNIYGERQQKLPVVDTITIESATETEYAYNNEMHKGYEIKLTWNYTEEQFADYQSSATITVIKNNLIYHIVEVQ